MKKYAIFVCLIYLLLTLQTEAQNKLKDSDFYGVPRISAYEAYLEYKAGKAIILFSGGRQYSGRHIAGSYNFDVGDKERDKLLLKYKFPKNGINILTYCYWTQETGSVGLALYLIEKGFRSVKMVRGGGDAMEKFFDYYIWKDGKGKIISPATGKEIVLNPHWSSAIAYISH